MLRASGAGAYSQGIACPSPSPHELGADEALVRATVRSVLTGALWHPARRAQEGVVGALQRPRPHRWVSCGGAGAGLARVRDGDDPRRAPSHCRAPVPRRVRGGARSRDPGPGWMVHADPVPGVEALRRRRLLARRAGERPRHDGDHPRRVRLVTTLRERRRERWRAARPAIAWTLGSFRSRSSSRSPPPRASRDAQQACSSAATPCPDATDPRLRWLLFAFVGVPLLWLLGLLLLAVRTPTRFRG